MNATLANWLDYDIAEFTPGQMTLSDIIAADGAALLERRRRRPGKTVDIVVDLKRRHGVSKPARLIHRVAFGPDGAPGPSRTLVLEANPRTRRVPRRGGGRAVPAHVQFDAAAARHARPRGGVRRANGAFARLAPAAMKVTRATLFTPSWSATTRR